MQFPRDPYLRGRFFQLKKSMKSNLKKAKIEQRNSILDKIQESESKDPNTFWKLVNEIRRKKYNNESIDAELFYNHFKYLHKLKENKKIDSSFQNKIKHILNATGPRKYVDILDKPVKSNEITEVVNSLKNKKAPGPDAIINEMIKICVPSLTRVFVKVINHLFICEEFPKTWTEGFISVLYKKGDMFNPNNYRGLTISNCLGRVVTKIMNRRLIKWLGNEGLIATEQIGFKPKQRTTDHILVLNTICDIYKSKHKAVYMCFVDLEKAFDSVNRHLLLYKLLKINISSKFLHLVRSLYQDMHTCLKINDCYTNSFPVEIGTRQGCNLSPNLFNIFINDFPNFLQSNN